VLFVGHALVQDAYDQHALAFVQVEDDVAALLLALEALPDAISGALQHRHLAQSREARFELAQVERALSVAVLVQGVVASGLKKLRAGILPKADEGLPIRRSPTTWKPGS
jgi:hypothetical protein